MGDRITALVSRRVLVPVVDSILPLREAVRAHERMANRDLFGKLLLAP